MEKPREILIHQSANRPHLLLGGDRELVLFAALMSAMLIFALVTWWGIAAGAALWVASVAGAVHATVSLLVVPSAGAVTLAMAGTLGGYGPAERVVAVLVADQALLPVAFALCTWTSIAAAAARPDRS